MPQLIRDNAGDARVAADLDHLARAYDDAAVDAANVAAEHARADDLELLAASYAAPDGGSEPSPWPALGRHLGRYRTWYALSIIVVAVLAFRSPVPLPIDETEEATTDLQAAEASPTTAVTPAIGPEFALPFEDLTASPSDDFATSLEPATVAVAPKAAPAATPLHIIESGYASAFAATPLEQPPPDNGLPVEAVAGSVAKYSFIRLTGDARSLRLRMLTDSGASVNDGQAVVQLCPITTKGWRGERGMATSDAPAYQANGCIGGARDSSGVWTFAFGLANPTDANGWALVPGSADNATFQVTFAPREVS